jgi:hypothetical protein
VVVRHSGRFALSVVLSLLWGLACAASRDKTTEEVIVGGTRLEIEQRVYTFVTGITHDGYARESLARWNKPICPLVAGIPRDQGEFILHHLSQAALAAGAPLASRKCKPNFHVVMVSEPDELLNLWRKRAPRLFGGESPTKVRRILSKPRPVRVWYNLRADCAEGASAAPQGDLNYGLASAIGECHIKDTRLEWNEVQALSSVIVIVDLDDIKEIKIGALTDYIAMVGLAEVDLDGEWGDAPTVLRLFAGSADAASQRMSVWDRSFLEALYRTSQKSRFQRSEVARRMVHGFVDR